MVAPFIVAYSNPDPEKLSAYECGFNAFDDARMKFDVRFYLVAILFIIFDLEVAFLFPWAVALRADARLVRLLVDDDLPRRADRRLRLRVEEGSPGMGVIADPPALPAGSVAPAPQGIIDPSTGQPVGEHDPFFDDDRAASWPTRAFVTAAPTTSITWARTGSLMWMTFGLACCAVEMMQMSMPRYDVERFGFAPRASPRQSRRDDRRRHPDQQDGAGPAQGLRPDAGAALRDLHGLLRQRRRLLPLSATRSCAAATGSCRSTSTCPGCPPTAEALLYGVLLLQKKIRRTGTIER